MSCWLLLRQVKRVGPGKFSIFQLLHKSLCPKPGHVSSTKGASRTMVMLQRIECRSAQWSCLTKSPVRTTRCMAAETRSTPLFFCPFVLP